jgi:hypothetical protein
MTQCRLVTGYIKLHITQTKIYLSRTGHTNTVMSGISAVQAPPAQQSSNSLEHPMKHTDTLLCCEQLMHSKKSTILYSLINEVPQKLRLYSII